MRILFVRRALVTFFTVTSLFGSAASVQFNGITASIEPNSASAARICIFKPYLSTPVNAPCEMRVYPDPLP